MTTRYIMTAFGQDRVGIVADVTEIIYEHDCNIEESDMIRLSDEFVIIFLFSCSKDNIEDSLLNACRRLERDKRIIAYFRALEEEVIVLEEHKPTHKLHIEGIDLGGILYKVSRLLAENDINIIHLFSQKGYSPLTGTTIYKADIEVQISAEQPVEEFKKKLRKTGNELHVDILFEEV